MKCTATVFTDRIYFFFYHRVQAACEHETGLITVNRGCKAIVKKVKCSLYRPGVAQRMGRGIALLFYDCDTRSDEWSAAISGRNLSPGKTRHPLYRRLGGPQGRSGRAEDLVPTRIRSRTVQFVFSRYTDRATGSTKL